MKHVSRILAFLGLMALNIQLLRASDSLPVSNISALQCASVHPQEVLIRLDPGQLPAGCTHFVLQRSADRNKFQIIKSFQQIPSTFILLADPVGAENIIQYRVLVCDQNGNWTVAVEQVFDICSPPQTGLNEVRTQNLLFGGDPHRPIE